MCIYKFIIIVVVVVVDIINHIYLYIRLQQFLRKRELLHIFTQYIHYSEFLHELRTL